MDGLRNLVMEVKPGTLAENGLKVPGSRAWWSASCKSVMNSWLFNRMVKLLSAPLAALEWRRILPDVTGVAAVSHLVI